MKHFLFDQIDSWFFKEARSMDFSGAAGRESIFPPASKTLLGAIRHQIGNRFHQQHGTSWSDFTGENCLSLRKIIGCGTDDYGSLQSQGVWLFHPGEQPESNTKSNVEEMPQLYFPLPANILQQEEAGMPPYTFFSLGKAMHCDLDTVRLPAMNFNRRQQTIENAWISTGQFSRLLTGQAPEKIIAADTVFAVEPRLGIGMNRQTRTVQQGMLFLTRHLRLQPEWRLYLGVEGIEERLAPNQPLLRLGGEARMGAITCLPTSPELPKPPEAKHISANNWLMLYLITPLPDWRGPEEKDMPPLPNKSFDPRQNSSGTTYWCGDICGLELNIYSAVVNKPERIGGWDLAKHQSTPVKSFIPAGSCWYIRPDSVTHAQKLISTLHGKHLTEDSERAQGLGQMLVGAIPAPAQD